jgi:thioredoxin reductase (NADPH)
MLTTEVENFPGFPEGIMGPELMARFREQALRFGTEVVTDKVTRVDLSARPFGVWVGDPDAAEPTYRSQAIIVSTGARSLMLGLEEEHRLLGRGLSTCATCDGFFFRDKDIAVVGGGDSALEEATFLTRFARSVTLVHRRDELRASKIMIARAEADPKISFAWNSVVTGIKGDNSVSALVLADTMTGETRELPVQGLFVAIGHDPRSELLRGQVDLDAAGYVLVDAPSTRTNLPGVFAAGDLVDHIYRQAITAAGTGCAAALDAERYLAALDSETGGAAILAEVGQV